MKSIWESRLQRIVIYRIADNVEEKLDNYEKANQTDELELYYSYNKGNLQIFPIKKSGITRLLSTLNW